MGTYITKCQSFLVSAPGAEPLVNRILLENWDVLLEAIVMLL